MKDGIRIETADVTLPEGTVRTEADYERMALEAGTMEIDIERLLDRQRRGVGRPNLSGNGPSAVLKVRLDTQTRAKLVARAATENRTPSAVARDAIKAWLQAS